VIISSIFEVDMEDENIASQTDFAMIEHIWGNNRVCIVFPYVARAYLPASEAQVFLQIRFDIVASVNSCDTR
jgi:hypothetical protein